MGQSIGIGIGIGSIGHFFGIGIGYRYRQNMADTLQILFEYIYSGPSFVSTNISTFFERLILDCEIHYHLLNYITEKKSIRKISFN